MNTPTPPPLPQAAPSSPPEIPSQPAPKRGLPPQGSWGYRIAHWILFGSLLVVTCLTFYGALFYWPLGILLGFEWLYIVASFGTMDNAYHGVKKVLGAPVKVVKPGLYHRLPGIAQVKKFPRKLVLLQMGTTPTDRFDQPVEYIQTSGEVILRRGSKLPGRVTFKAGEEKERRDDPLHGRLTSDPEMIARYWVEDPIVFDYQIGSLEELDLVIEGVAMPALQELCSVRTAAGALADIGKLNAEITARIDDLVGESHTDDLDKPYLGVRFGGIEIKSFGFSHPLNQAIAASNAAGFEKQKVVTAAEGEEKKLTLEGAGKASARGAYLQAEVIPLRAQAEVAKTPGGQFALHQQALIEGLKAGKHTIIAADPLLTTAAALKAAWTGSEQPPLPPTGPSSEPGGPTPSQPQSSPPKTGQPGQPSGPAQSERQDSPQGHERRDDSGDTRKERRRDENRGREPRQQNRGEQSSRGESRERPPRREFPKASDLTV